MTASKIAWAAMVIPCDELDETLSFFVDRLGFRVDAVFPADDPSVAEISGHGVRLRLERGRGGDRGCLRLELDDPRSVADGAAELTAPNGTRVQLAQARPPLRIPPLEPSFVLTRAGDAASWTVGRAGMRYRDLVGDRQGGRFIASHIRIPDGGPVPDYVHYHRVRFQTIFCRRGWVRVVYEDQGEPFVLETGDCVVQPPEIRHRVLECSPGLEVVELGCPAEHETRADHELPLPTDTVRADRDFDGQRFVRHVAREASWTPWRLDGWEHRDTGIANATDGLATVRVARPVEASVPAAAGEHDGELLFLFVLDGHLRLGCDGHGEHALESGDAVVIPPARRFTLTGPSADAELLEVALPGD